MSIIISQHGKNAVKLDKSSFDKEDHLQQYIYNNPESIPLYDIKEDIRLLVLAREFPTNSGPIDAIGIDKYGSLYIVETKLYKNADKRTVVAQALDYGAALWKHSNDFQTFTALLDTHCQKVFKQSLHDKIANFFGLGDEEIETLLNVSRDNLNDGVFHFVVLMDQLDSRLKDLILYVNHNSQFDIYAVELEYYKHDTFEIIIPKIFGAEVKKDIAVKSGATSQRNKWDESSMLENAREMFSLDEFEAFNKIYQYAKEHADKINFGTGSYGSFSPIFEKLSSKSLFSLSTSPNYSLGMNFEWVAKNGREDTAIAFKQHLDSIGFSIPDDYLYTRPSVSKEEWVPKTDAFIGILNNMLIN